MMMSNQLKQLAKDYNLFIFSSTQVNAEGMANDTTGFRNETCIRGAKSIVDKADVGFIMTRTTDKELQELRQALVNYRDPNTGMPITIPNVKPNMVMDIYKNRRGQYKNIRIWANIDLGTGERTDLFITYANNTPLPTNTTQMGIITEQISKDWNNVNG